MKSIFIVTSHIHSEHQAYLLLECILSIQQHHPESDIVILHDSTNKSIVPTYVVENFAVGTEKKSQYWQEDVEEKYQRCGEVNAYVWACKHYEEYDRFIFVHDSTKLLTTLPLELPESMLFRAMWYSKNSISADTEGEAVVNIIKSFSLNIHTPWSEIRQGGGNGNVTFGAMGIFKSEFAKKLATETNFLEIANLFNVRTLRCFFERFIWCIVATWQDRSNYRNETLCGCICNHGEPFKNTHPHAHMARNPYIVKSWVGR
jgi:hypothetical protein